MCIYGIGPAFRNGPWHSEKTTAVTTASETPGSETTGCKSMIPFLWEFMSSCPSVGQSVCLPVCLSVCMSVCLYVCLSICRSVWRSVGRSVGRSVCLSVRYAAAAAFGRNLWSSAPRNIAIARAAYWNMPTYAHICKHRHPYTNLRLTWHVVTIYWHMLTWHTVSLTDAIICWHTQAYKHMLP